MLRFTLSFEVLRTVVVRALGNIYLKKSEAEESTGTYSGPVLLRNLRLVTIASSNHGV